jgi:hypothetical protein
MLENRVTTCACASRAAKTCAANQLKICYSPGRECGGYSGAEYEVIRKLVKCLIANDAVADWVWLVWQRCSVRTCEGCVGGIPKKRFDSMRVGTLAAASALMRPTVARGKFKGENRDMLRQ